MDDVKLKKASEHGIQPPLALLAELSHRCPLQCPYCSNPVQLEKKTGELTTDEWKSVIDQAVEMGMHQIHLSGGEPTVRHDLEDIVEHCTTPGLYTNLITSGVILNPARLKKHEKHEKHIKNLSKITLKTCQKSDGKGKARQGRGPRGPQGPAEGPERPDKREPPPRQPPAAGGGPASCSGRGRSSRPGTCPWTSRTGPPWARARPRAARRGARRRRERAQRAGAPR